MKKNTLIRFVHSLVFIPVMTMPLSFGTINSNEIDQGALVQKFNITTFSSLALNQTKDTEADKAQQILEVEADAIDAYFKAHNMPLQGLGMKMAQEAKANDIDWRLLPAIAVRESTGGKHACTTVKFNSFGWGSCKIGFKSNEEAIEIVARNLGGNNPNTDYHYAGKTTKEILQKYNPPSIVPNYAAQVMKIMNDIGDEDVTVIDTVIKNT